MLWVSIEVYIPSQESERSFLCMLWVSIEVYIPSQESERACICMLWVSVLSLSTILIYHFGITPTV